MASMFLTRDLEAHIPAQVPRVGLVVNALLSMLTIGVLAFCLTRRIQSTGSLSSIPLTKWLLFAIYIDSIVFIIATNILANGFGVNLNQEICASTILLCLTCYLSTKIIYYFLVEKVYIIRRVNTPRLKSKLYCFNCFGMLLPYCVVVILNYVYRISYLREDGVCIIGMQKKSMLPLIIFDAVVNFYLTMLFVLPLRGLYSYKNSPNSALKTIAVRSFFGALGTLTSSVVNLTILMVLQGEPAWVCLMCCNADVLFSVIVLHWVTSKDNVASPSTRTPRGGATSSRDNTGLAKGYGLGSAIRPTVTTHITANKGDVDGNSLDEEMGIEATSPRREKSDWGRKANGNKDTSGDGVFPLGKIRVQVGRVVEIETEPSGMDMGRGSEASSTAAGMSHGREKMSQSTEDLVERERTRRV